MRKARILHLALAAGIVALLIAYSHPGELWTVLRQVDLRLAAASVFLNVPVALLAPLRSSLVYRRLGHSPPPAVLVPTTIVGFVAGGLTPAASGELLRAVGLRNRAGVPVAVSMVAVVYERVLALYFLGLTTATVFALARLALVGQVLVVGAAVALGLLPCLFAAALPRSPGIDQKPGNAGWWPTAWRRALAMAGQLQFLLADPRLLLRWSSITVVMFAVIAFQYWLLARGVSSQVSYGDAWLALGVSTLAAVATLVPLGLGVLDVSLAAALDRLGASLEQGAILALLVRATVTLPLVLAAFACYVYLERTDAPAVNPAPTDIS